MECTKLCSVTYIDNSTKVLIVEPKSDLDVAGMWITGKAAEVYNTEAEQVAQWLRNTFCTMTLTRLREKL